MLPGDLTGAGGSCSLPGMLMQDTYDNVCVLCVEDDKPGIAGEVIDRALQKFPGNQMLIGRSVSVWCSVKQFQKALTLVKQLNREGVHSDEVQLNCAQTLHQCSENEESYQWLNKLLTRTDALSDEMKQEVDVLKGKLDAEAKLQ
ncbi:uncharacterized protein LOC124289680 [Haliotis rubra]|uniref:uncharacterized protein LOC124289680 n=1 Tax=Haliotis rubra TaxID=36100 RepID=UPI001EE5F6DD|nr:uncharacterized protein LOC124289680 [Haliotis rubra]